MITVVPNKLTGDIHCPPSKSLAHRAIICASLAEGNSVISGLEYSDDIVATIQAMESLGTKIEIEKDVCFIYPNQGILKEHRVIDCNESGSTLRFLVPISTLYKGKSTFIGRGNLGKRPLTMYYDIFKEQGLYFQAHEGELHLEIEGSLSSGKFICPGNVSSQFISGLLFTLPKLVGESVISIVGELESKGYVDLTLDMLSQFGINVINRNYQEFIVKGNQQYQGSHYQVEGDYSQAAFFLVAKALGNHVEVLGLNPNSKQGDKAVLDIIERLLDSSNDSVVIDAGQCPDIIPVVALLACVQNKHVEIVNAGRLRIKECDRLSATCLELSKLNANIREDNDNIIIEGGQPLIGCEVSSHNDHRMAMMLAMASTVAEGDIILDNHTCVSKSYPSFWEVFESLGGKYHE